MTSLQAAYGGANGGSIVRMLGGGFADFDGNGGQSPQGVPMQCLS